MVGAVMLSFGEFFGLRSAVRSCIVGGVETCAAAKLPPRTALNAASLRTRSACALVYSVFNCSRRADRMLVFSSGLMTFNSRSNATRHWVEDSILDFSSPISFSI
jgi:hypothetical protein